jgi:hypothetical protein
MARDRKASKPAGPKPASDAYTGLLVIALLAQVAGAVFLWMDYSQYPETKPPLKPPSGPTAAAPGPAGQGGVPGVGGNPGAAGNPGMMGGAPGMAGQMGAPGVPGMMGAAGAPGMMGAPPPPR